MPVPIMAGHGDKIVGNRQAERLHAAIPGSSLRITEGVGHMIHHIASKAVTAAVTELSREADGSAAKGRSTAPASSGEPVVKAG